MGNYKVVRELNKRKWSEFVYDHPYGNIFQTPEMFDFFESVPNYSPEIVAVADKQDNIKALVVAVLQKEGNGLEGFFSRRAIVFGGPVIDEKEPKIEIYLEILLKELDIILKNKSIYIEFRNFNDYSKFKKIFKRCGYEYRSHINFHIDCVDETEMLNRISSSKRRQIRNSLKNGAEIIVAKSEDEIFQFYNILKILYKKKVKKPLPSKEYFINFFKNQNLGRYLLIKYKDKIIGGIMCPILNNRVIYEAYVAGEDKKYKKIYPSILATYAAMDYAVKNKIKRFDFMGAGKPDQDYGVREFKSKFGGELVDFGRFEKINNKFLYFIGKTGLKILKK